MNDDDVWEGRMNTYMEEAERQMAALRAALDQERRRLAWIAYNTGRDVWLDQFGRRFSKGEGVDGADDLRAAIDALLSERGEGGTDAQ